MDTKLILAYFEGVKDGRRLSQSLKEAAKAKPVIVLKGGLGEAGARATASHTGALAGSDEVWDGVLRQAGAIRVYSLEELLDMAVTFTYFSLPPGNRTAILGFGGGATVLATDDCARAGLAVPHSPIETQDKMKSYVRAGGVGISLNNPVDLSAEGMDPDVLYNCGRTLIDCDSVDLLLLHLSLDTFLVHPYVARDELLLPTLEIDEEDDNPLKSIIRIHKDSEKPMAIVIHSIAYAESYQNMLEVQRVLSGCGLPVYHSLSNSARAIARFMDYHKRRAETLDMS